LKNIHVSFFLIVGLLGLTPAISRAYTSDDYYQAGLSLYQQKNYPQAVSYFKAAIQMDPGNWQAFQVLGYCDYAVNDIPDAESAFDQSLKLNPNNPGLQSFDNNLRAQNPPLFAPVTAATAPAPGNSPNSENTPAAVSQMPIPDNFKKPRWGNVYIGGVYATMGDLPAAASAVKKNYAYENPTVSVSNIGFEFGAEGGFTLDPYNAIGLEVGGAYFAGYQDSVSYSGHSGSDTYQPTMIDVGLKYIHSFLTGGSGFQIGAGLGLYITDLNVNQMSDSTILATGPMIGIGWGGTLDLGWETNLGGPFSLNASLRGRFATTSNIQGQFKDSSGNLHQLGLATDSTGIVGLAQTSAIGTNGIRWANVDYTGADLAIGLTYHY